MTNKNITTLYTGITSNLQRRVQEHKTGVGIKFSHRYKISKLVYYEITNDFEAAIKRKKQIKAGSRKKKLIQSIRSILSGKIYQKINDKRY